MYSLRERERGEEGGGSLAGGWVKALIEWTLAMVDARGLTS